MVGKRNESEYRENAFREREDGKGRQETEERNKERKDGRNEEKEEMQVVNEVKEGAKGKKGQNAGAEQRRGGKCN